MNRVSVVSVTYNNVNGLSKTLKSLVDLNKKPMEVIIVDGGSNDGTAELVSKYMPELNITFVSENDKGIYDAMNKGKALSAGDLIHYLNAGDTVHGKGYDGISHPGLLKVGFYSEQGKFLNFEKKLFGGHGYNHQGVIFPSDHPDYDLSFKISADINCMIGCFRPKLVSDLDTFEYLEVKYEMGGVSSKRRLLRDRELTLIFIKNGLWTLLPMHFISSTLKYCAPVALRRWLRAKL